MQSRALKHAMHYLHLNTNSQYVQPDDVPVAQSTEGKLLRS